MTSADAATSRRDVWARGLRKGWATCWELAKVIVPVSVAVTALKHTPVLPWLSAVSEPLMRWLGLSGEAAVVLVAGNAVGLYPAIGAMASLNLSAKEVLTLALMLSFSHNLLVETAVTKRLGVSYWGVIAYRVGLAVVAALLVNVAYGLFTPEQTVPAPRPAAVEAAAGGQGSTASVTYGAAVAGTGTEASPAAAEPARGPVRRALRDWFGTVAADAAGGLSRTLGLMVVIIFPLMVAIEALEASGALERISRRIEPYMGWLGLSGKAGFPLMAGLVFGLAYGAGVLLEASRDGGLTQKDKRLLCVFLVACHAVVEDTFLFVPLGINPFLLLGGRLILAVLLTAAAARAAALASRLGEGMAR